MIDIFAKKLMTGVPVLAEHLDHIEVSIPNAPLHGVAQAILNIDLTRDLRYKLLCNRTATPFIISDDPVVMYNQFLETRKRPGCNTGLAIKGLQLFLPLGPRHMLVFFDPDVYKVGSRNVLNQRVELTVETDVRELNLLQAANARESLYFNESMPFATIVQTVEKAMKYRPEAKAVMNEYHPANGDTASDVALLHWFRPDLRTRLRLSMIRLTPHAEQYQLENRVTHYRDPLFVRVHDEFVKGVRDGRYRVGQFKEYLDGVIETGQPPTLQPR